MHAFICSCTGRHPCDNVSDGKGNQLTNNVIVVWSREMQVGMAVAKPQKLG